MHALRERFIPYLTFRFSLSVLWLWRRKSAESFHCLSWLCACVFFLGT